MTDGHRSARRPTDEELAAAVPHEGSGREFRIGIFVLLGLVSFITVLFLLTDPATLRGRYMVVTELLHAGGIRRGDPVQMRGVNIGRVHGFEMTDDGRVAVTLEIEGEWGIPRGSEAVLAESGLFGGRTLEVVAGPGDEPMAEGDTMPGRDEGGGVMDVAGRVAEEAEVVLQRLAMVLDTPTVGAVRTSAHEVEGLTRELRALLSEQREEIVRLTATLNRAAAGLETTADAAGPELASAAARADSLLAGLEQTRGRLDSALGSLDSVLGRMERGEGTLGRLSRDEALYDNLAAAVISLDSLLVDIRLNPKRYVTIEIF
jgi:phospholipid/cholesterol/gamma-HCH transport system substrate-binding protein